MLGALQRLGWAGQGWASKCRPAPSPCPSPCTAAAAPAPRAAHAPHPCPPPAAQQSRSAWAAHGAAGTGETKHPAAPPRWHPARTRTHMQLPLQALGVWAQGRGAWGGGTPATATAAGTGVRCAAALGTGGVREVRAQPCESAADGRRGLHLDARQRQQHGVAQVERGEEGVGGALDHVARNGGLHARIQHEDDNAWQEGGGGGGPVSACHWRSTCSRLQDSLPLPLPRRQAVSWAVGTGLQPHRACRAPRGGGRGRRARAGGQRAGGPPLSSRPRLPALPLIWMYSPLRSQRKVPPSLHRQMGRGGRQEGGRRGSMTSTHHTSVLAAAHAFCPAWYPGEQKEGRRPALAAAARTTTAAPGGPTICVCV